MEPNGFDVNPPRSVPPHVLDRLRSLQRGMPPRQEQPPAGGTLMDLDTVGLYLLNYHRPGSTNPSMGVAVDYAFRVGRRSIFGYSLSRLLGTTGRDIMHAFRRQFVFLVALP